MKPADGGSASSHDAVSGATLAPSGAPPQRILLLGGTGEGLQLARLLPVPHVYSLAGVGTAPTDLSCLVRVGGFGGVDGLTRFIEREEITLVVDATHPYAARMSANAAAACRATQRPCWVLRRPAWTTHVGDDWRDAADWPGVIRAIAPYRRPLFTLGRAPLAHLHEIPGGQYWTVRCLETSARTVAPLAGDPGSRATIVSARGPFTEEGERRFFAEHRIDVIISKQSGGAATEAKLAVARAFGLPVVMLTRPVAPAADLASTRTFSDPAMLSHALVDILSGHRPDDHHANANANANPANNEAGK